MATWKSEDEWVLASLIVIGDSEVNVSLVGIGYGFVECLHQDEAGVWRGQAIEDAECVKDGSNCRVMSRVHVQLHIRRLIWTVSVLV